MPEFTYRGIALNPEKLNWAPADLEHPTFIKTEGLIENAMGKYYLYYAPHKHLGIGLAYADTPAGPWIEYEGNPLIEHCAAPDVRWIENRKKFYLWAHRKNSQTELWTSENGLRFEHQGVSIKADAIGTKNATYTRFYEYPIEKFGSKYILLYVGYVKSGNRRCIWLAHSNDAEHWTQLPEPIVQPAEGEGEQLYDPAFFQWKGRNYIVYSDVTAWRGGNLNYVEIDREFSPVKSDSERYVLIQAPNELNGRLRSPQFIIEDRTIHMIAGGSSKPRVYVYYTAEADDQQPDS